MKSLGLTHFLSEGEICRASPFRAAQVGEAMEFGRLRTSMFNPHCDFRKDELHSVDMTNDRRRVPRYSAHVKASIKLPAESTALAVVVEDLCVLGCLLEYAPTLEIRQECDFAMTWKGREFRTPAAVAWRSDQGQVGLEFHNTDPANHQLLREVCAEFSIKPLVRLPEGHE